MKATARQPRHDESQPLGTAVADETEIPAWVPPEFRAGYRKVAAERGEEDAVAWARRMKNGDPEVPARAKPLVRKSYGSITTPTQSASAETGFAWTEAREADVRRLHGEGWSAGAIAAEIGAPTRNVVIGKISRLGLKRDPGPIKPKIALLMKERGAEASTLQPETLRKPIVRKPVVAQAPAAQAPVEALPATTEADAAPADAITIHELRDRRCHWPFGDPRDDGFRYCGAPVPREREEWEPCYCAGHQAIAYTPAKGRGR